MKKQDLYEKTIGILVKAYQEDTIIHGSCFACVFGNLVASNCGYSYVYNTYNDSLNWDNDVLPAWDEVFITQRYEIGQVIRPYNYKGEAKRQIDSTGYEWQNGAKIEYAFETNYKGNSESEKMFNALMAVVDVLNEIHEVEEKELSKNLFVKA